MAEPVPIWHEGSETEQASALDFGFRSAVMPEVVQSADRLLAMPDVSGVAIAHEDPTRSAMLCVVSRGSSAPPAGTLLDVSSGISGRCVRENRMLHSYDALIDPRANYQACAELGIRSLAIAPLQHNSRCIGVLEVFSEEPGAFDEAMRKKIEEEAKLVAALLRTEDALGLKDSELKDPEATEPNHLAEEMTTIADTRSESELVSDCDPTGDADEENTSTIAEPHSADPLHFDASFPARAQRRGWKIIIPVLAGTVGIFALLFIRNAHHTSGARLSAPVLLPSPSSAARVITQAPAVPSKLSEHEANVVSPPVRKLIESAASGDVTSQVSLANRYAKGDGLPADKVKAAAWYIVAGAHGSGRAKRESVLITHDLPQFEIGEIRFNVGKMYSEGVGSQRDLVAAYSWFSLAQAAGDVRAQSEQEKLEHMMTDEQVSEAFRRASGWLAGHRTRTRAHHARETIALVPPNG